MQKLLITRRLPDKVLDRAEARFEVSLRDTGDALGLDEASAALRTYDAILPTLGDAFGATSFPAAESLRTKVLANFGVGYNHIDAEAARAAGVMVTNTPDVVTDATADIGLTLILMACRRAGEGERLVRAGRWAGWQPTEFLGLHVTGRTVGIVGMGRIGKAVARRCHGGFGMEVVFFNRSAIADVGVPARQLDTLEDVLRSADIVVLTVPATPKTRHLIDAAALAQMQSHAILVNIARGDIIDETALVEALGGGTIAAAGLDVYEREPTLAPGLAALENAVLLPHLGTAALEVREAMGLMALDNIEAALDGRTPPNLV